MVSCVHPSLASVNPPVYDVGMPNVYVTDNGDSIAIDPTDVTHVKALETLTGRSTDDLLREAVNDIRQKLVPSTRPAPAARAGRKQKGEK